MPQTNQITVLMPCRDAQATVAQAVQSILRQRGVAVRLLAVDDGSRDGTLRILNELSAADARLRVVEQKRLGLVAALNLGLSLVETDYLARQDADDVSHPDRLRLQLDLLEQETHLDVTGCMLCGFPASAVGQGMRRYEEWQNALITHSQMERELFVESPLAHATLLMKSSTLQEAGGFRRFDGPEDWDLWARLLQRGCRFSKVARRLYFWREHPDRTTRKDTRLSEENFRRAKLEALLAGPMKDRSAVELWSWGNQGEAWNRLLSGSPDMQVRYLQINPRPLMAARTALPPIIRARDTLVLLAYGSPKVRTWFRKALAARGGREGEDFILLR